MDAEEEQTALSEPPPTDLWSSILDSVSSSRSIPSKNVLILGEPGSGKSTVAAALLGKPPTSISSSNEKGADNNPSTLNSKNSVDFSLGYDYSDVRDDGGDESDVLARLSVYTVPSSSRAFTSLIPYFLPPRTTLGQTACIVVLDWTKPWTFVDQLEEWFAWIESWAKGEGAVLLQKDKEMERELEMLREENHERWQAHLQHYTEPSSTSTLPTSASTSIPTSTSSTVLPLGPGTLTHNSAGIPIVVVCAKADLIDEEEQALQQQGAAATGIGGGMVKGKGGEWEEKTDGIMQILRTICLKYGASLFYTTPLPETLSILRQYVLHTLFVPPAPSSLSISSEAPQNQSSQQRTDGQPPQPPPHKINPFPFLHKPNTLDRDRVVIPSGWDSYGKITVLREFDPKMWGAGWERDLEVWEERERDRQRQENSRGGAQTAVPGDLEDPEDGAKRMYASLVPDQGINKLPSLPPFNSPTPEQAFLAKHYDDSLNANANVANANAAGAGGRGLAKDPRGAFRNPPAGYGGVGYGAGAGVEYDGGIYGAGAGLVGPMGTNSFNLPNVEKYFTEMERSSLSSSTGAGANLFSSTSSANDQRPDRLSGSIGPGTSSSTERSTRVRPATHGHPGRPAPPSNLLSPTFSSSSPPHSGVRSPPSPSLSPTGSNGGSGPGSANATGTQHEVLQNFFQSLLVNKDRPGAAAAAGLAGGGSPVSTIGSAMGREGRTRVLSNGSTGSSGSRREAVERTYEDNDEAD